MTTTTGVTLIETQLEEVTPLLAREWLERNTRNRTVSMAHVQAMARDMKMGLWQLSHQGIAFDVEGNLLDGQHRLIAITEANTPVKMFVTRGVPSGAMTVLDIGRRRGVADMLGIEGYKNTSVVAAVARLALLYDLQDYTAKTVKMLSPTAVHEYAKANMTALSEAAYRTHGYKGSIPTTTAVTGASWYIFNRVDIVATEQFFNALAYMRTDGPGDPRLALMRRLSSMRSEREHKPQNQFILDLFIRSWNAWREGKELDKLPLTRANLAWRPVK